MIAFDSSAGSALRAMNPSRPALAALWFTALTEDQTDWAAWAKEKIETDHATDAVVIALYLLQAANDGNYNSTRQLWTVLASFPIEGNPCRIMRAARDIGRAFES